jgi:hypothetical protein
MRLSKAVAPPRNASFSPSPISPMKSVIQQVPDLGLEVLLVRRVHLGCDLQLDISALCDPDRAIDPLLGANAAEEGKVSAGSGWNR